MVIELLPKVEHNTCGREEDMDAGTAAYQETDPVELQGSPWPVSRQTDLSVAREEVSDAEAQVMAISPS